MAGVAGAGRGDRAPRVSLGEAGARGEAIEGTDRGESLGNRRPGVPLAELPQVGAQGRARRLTPVDTRVEASQSR